MTRIASRPIVTVITPTKNRLELLRETVDSVSSQTFCEWEHIIVDDGSNDGTTEELQRRSNWDPRIIYIKRSGKKKGANVCRNLGLAGSRGEYIIFIDSDDILRPYCLSNRVAFMDRNLDLDFAVFPAGVFAKSVGDLPSPYHPMNHGDDLLRFLSNECLWQTTGPIWRRSFLIELGGFDEKLLSGQDLDLHVRAITALGRYLVSPGTDHDIRSHEDEERTSRQHFRNPAYIRGNAVLRDKLLAEIRQNGLITWSRKRALLGLGFSACEMWLSCRKPMEAYHTWHYECNKLNASWSLWIEGVLLLTMTAASLPTKRLRGKWKGWRRLRPEPVPSNFLA